MKAKTNEGKSTPVEDKGTKVSEPSKDEELETNKKEAEPHNEARKVTSASHHPENVEHLKNIQQAVGHLSEETGPAPAAVKEVQEVLKKAQAMTGAAKGPEAPQFVADPHQAKL